MNFKTVCAVLLVLLVAAAAQAQRGGRGRGRGRGRKGGKPAAKPKPANVDGYSWQLDLGNSVFVSQEAFVNNDKNVSYVKSFDPVIEENNMTDSVVLYDSSSVVAIQLSRRGSPCFLTSTATSYDGIVAEVLLRNGTQVPVPVVDITLNATAPPLSRDEAKEVLTATPSLLRFCKGRRIVQTTAAASGDSDDDADTEVKTALMLEGRVNIIIPSRASRPNPPGPGGRGGGRPQKPRPPPRGGRGGRGGRRPGGRRG